MGLKKVVYRWRIGDVNLGDENARDEDLGWKICRWNWWWQFYFHLLIFHPLICHFFSKLHVISSNKSMNRGHCTWPRFWFFPPDRVVVLVVRQVKKTKSQWPEEEVFFNYTKGTTNNPASIFHLLLLDINKGKKNTFWEILFNPLSIPFRESRKGCVCVEKF